MFGNRNKKQSIDDILQSIDTGECKNMSWHTRVIHAACGFYPESSNTMSNNAEGWLKLSK
ncbi:MAG TPA: hypothetical protein VK654_07935 [Nitrospirota bacterium]|nr:hypothetical protein [Nitrospirota bacterium]